MSSPYEILGISEDATLDDARRAYRRLALRYHPDRFVDRPAEEVAAAQAAFVEVQLAFEEVESLIRSGTSGARTRSSSGARQRRARRTTTPPGPTATQIVEHEVAQVLNDAARERRMEGFPWAFLAQRVSRGVLGSMGDVSWMGIPPRSDADRAGLGLAAFILRPPKDALFDETMVAFASRVALLALRRLGPSLTEPTRSALWAKVPDAAQRTVGFQAPTFCHVCLVAPASHLPFEVVIGTLFWHDRQYLPVRRCADCAEPLFRDVQSAQLRSGWWSPSGVFLTPLQLWRNHRMIAGARASGPTTRPRELPVAPMTPPISSRKASWIAPAVVATIVAWFVSQAIGGSTSTSAAHRTASHATRSSTTTARDASAPAPPTTSSGQVGALPRLASAWKDPKVPDGLSGDAGPVIRSAGRKTRTYSGITLNSGVVESFTLNFPEHTTEDQARWLLGVALPADARTTYVEGIKSYDNARDVIVGECLAWDLSSDRMAADFGHQGIRGQRVISVALYTEHPYEDPSSTTTVPKGTKRLSKAERKILKVLESTPFMVQGDYDPSNVTSATVFTMKPPKPTNQCWAPEPDPYATGELPMPEDPSIPDPPEFP